MREVLIGTVAAVAVLLVGALVPRLMHAKQAARKQAIDQTVLASRQLYAYDPRQELVPLRADPARLREADPAKLYEQARDAFAELSKLLSNMVQKARRTDQQTGLKPAHPLPAGPINPAAIRQATRQLERLLAANRQLLTQAVRLARAAMGQTRQADLPGLTVGTGRISEATTLLARAEYLRALLAAARSETLLVAARIAELQAARMGSETHDPGPLREALETHKHELQGRIDAQQRQIEDLKRQIRQRKDQLARLEGQLRELRARQQHLIDAGFTAGDDAAFADYANKLASLADQIRQLEQQTRLIRDGGLRGATLPEDLIRGPIRDGQPVPPLDWLEAELARRQDVLRRLERAADVMDAQLRRLEAVSNRTQARASELAAQIEQLRRRLAQRWKHAEQLRQQAVQTEDKALAAARDAATAFDRARRAIETWQRQAQDQQQQFDPQRKNERLRKILADRMAEVLARASKAQALVVSARILALRAESDRRLVETAKRVTNLVQQVKWDVANVQTAADQARTHATESLTQARQELDRARQRATAAQWVFNAQLAIVHHLLAQVDPANASQHRIDAIQALRTALEGREQSPYVQPFVRLYTHLTGGTTPAQPAPQQPGPDQGTTP